MGGHLMGVYPVGVDLMGVDLSGPKLPPAHIPAYHCVGWHVVVCYGGPEWFRLLKIVAPEVLRNSLACDHVAVF
jgi:hypothetical protein